MLTIIFNIVLLKDFQGAIATFLAGAVHEII